MGDAMTLNASVDVVEGPTLYGAGSFKYEGVVLGGEVKYNTAFDEKDSSPTLMDYSGALAYTANDFTASLTTKKKASQFVLGVHHNVSKEAKVAATYAHSAKLLTVGGIYNFDDATT